MSRLKLLVTNIGFFGGLKVLSSLFPLLILPYVTSKLGSTEEFGYYDLFTVIGGLLCSISMLGLQDAMFRQYHVDSEDEYRKNVNSTGFILVVLSSFIIAILFIVLLNTLGMRFLKNEMSYSVISLTTFYVITQNLMNISVHPSRLINDKKRILLYTLLYAIVFYVSVIILLQYSLGVYSLIYAHFIVGVFLTLFFIRININRLSLFRFKKKIAIDLLRVGLPLMPIFLIYWANNSVARVMIVKYLNASELGVFAIGSKYAAISTFIQMAFAGGWSFFTFSTMKDEDQTHMKSKIFKTLLLVIVIGYAFIVPIIPWFYNHVFQGEYVRGYTVFNQLFLSPLFLILYQIVANQFTIMNKSFYSLISLSIGVSIGLILCIYLLSNGMGIISVSYTIPLGYLISLFVALFFAKKQNAFSVEPRILISFLFIIGINLIAFVDQSFKAYIYLIPLLMFYLWFNKKDVLEMIAVATGFAKSIRK